MRKTQRMGKTAGDTLEHHQQSTSNTNTRWCMHHSSSNDEVRSGGEQGSNYGRGWKKFFKGEAKDMGFYFWLKGIKL